MDEWLNQAEAWAGQAERWIRQQPPEQIYLAVAVVAFTILLLITGDVPNLSLPPQFCACSRVPEAPRSFLCDPTLP